MSERVSPVQTTRAGTMRPQHRKFVLEYLKDYNGKQAAIRAGYAPGSAEVTASRLLSTAKVRSDLDMRFRRAEATAARTLEEIRRLAYHDPRSLFNADGNLKPIHTLSADEAASIASVEVIIKNAAAGDGHTDTICKVKTWDKVAALTLLAKHFRLVSEHYEITGSVDVLVGRLHAARQRIGEGDVIDAAP